MSNIYDDSIKFERILPIEKEGIEFYSWGYIEVKVVSKEELKKLYPGKVINEE